jgi:hypothetical protein
MANDLAVATTHAAGGPGGFRDPVLQIIGDNGGARFEETVKAAAKPEPKPAPGKPE